MTPMQSLPFPVVEEAFKRVGTDIQRLISLDGVEALPDQAGFLIRSHDPFGPLPDVQVSDLNEPHSLLEQIETEAAKRYVVARIRQEILEKHPEARFLSPVCEDKVYVGIALRGFPIISAGKDYLGAYDNLRARLVEIGDTL